MQLILIKSQIKILTLLMPLVFVALDSAFGSLPDPSFHQQEMLTVYGNVSDSVSGNSLGGVAIQVKGITAGTITDMEGNYSIVVRSGDMLVFSFVGYRNKEITIKDETEIDVQLAEDIIRLD